MTEEIKASARVMLGTLDGFMSGSSLTDADNEVQKAVSLAGCFAAAAYEAAQGGGADVHALTRSFLLALIDPTDPALDYLRADQAAGAAARDAAAQLNKITQS